MLKEWICKDWVLHKWLAGQRTALWTSAMLLCDWHLLLQAPSTVSAVASGPRQEGSAHSLHFAFHPAPDPGSVPSFRFTIWIWS